MFSSNVDIKAILGDFVIEGMMFRYSSFMGRLYNFCRSLGLEKGKMLPSAGSVRTKTKATLLF